MSTRLPFQYTTLRYMHDAFTGEFINVGLVMYSHKVNYFRSELLMRYQRLSDTFKGADGDYYRSYIFRLQDALARITDKTNRPQIALPSEGRDQLAGLLAEVLPPDDSSVQFGPIRFGVDENLDRIFDALYERLVTRYAEQPPTESRDDEDVWQVYRKPLQDSHVLQHLTSHRVTTPYENFEFAHAWKNGAWNVLQPISLDLSIGTRIRSKARQWLGTAQVLADAENLHQVFVLLGRPRRSDADLRKAYRDAVQMLEKKSGQLNVEFVEEDRAEEFARRLKPLVEEHLAP